MNRRSLLGLAAAIAIAAVLLAVSGGVRANVGGLRLSARSPWPAAALAVLSLGAWAFLARRARAISSDLEGAWSFVDRRAMVFVIVIAASSGALSLRFSTRSASGADASGYLSEAGHLASGQLRHVDSLSTQLNFAFERGITSPLGWRPSTVRGWQSPTYPPGLPLLMVLPYLIAGTAGACAIVSVSAAVAVWATGAIAIEVAGGAAGVIGAIAIASAPVFLFQSMQPMSDVPVTAAWMLCWFLMSKRSNWAGVACAIAVLIRPNLAPLALVPFLFTRGSRVRFAIPVVVAGLCLALLQWFWYGSPLRTGYGTAEELFAFGNTSANLSRYFGWLLETSPTMLLAALGWWFARRRPWATPLAVFSVLVVAAYLGYAVFDEWSYLRFLLPAIAICAVFVGALGFTGLTRVPASARLAIAFAAMLALLAQSLTAARSRDTFRLVDQQSRIVQIAGAMLAKLAPADVIVSGEQSGSMRFYTGHEIVRWDAITTEEWNLIVDTLTSNGHGVWIVLDAWEEPLFRAKTGEQTGVLDWPPAIDAGDTHRTRAWRLSDRDRFVAGENVATERIR